MLVLVQASSVGGIDAKSEPQTEDMHCSFCGKSRKQVRKLIGNQDSTALICEQCVGLAGEIIAEEDRRASEGSDSSG